MQEITAENFDAKYVDPVEERQIDKFLCDEMGRQIHRYIKAMKGSKKMMEKFEEQLSTLTIPEKEEAIARYIDLNRKVLAELAVSDKNAFAKVCEQAKTALGK